MTAPSPVYLDNHASTPVDPRVVEALLPYFTERFGNPASAQHRYGWEADAAVDVARRQVAALLGADVTEIVFNAGATEGNNLALMGALAVAAEEGRTHAITQATEHKGVLLPLAEWERRGQGSVTVLPVDSTGMVDPAAVEAAITEKTAIVSVMAANNEVGTLQPLAEIGAICKARGVLFHTDAAQAVGKVPLDVKAAGIDLLSLSAHKLYGPKGVGALYVRRKGPRVALRPQILGGGHEWNLRSGTLNVPGIVGLGKACALAAEELESDARRIAALRSDLLAGLRRVAGDLRVNGHPERRLAGNLHVTFFAQPQSVMRAIMQRVAVSAGSACTTATDEPSHVLRAIGLSEDDCRTSLRFGLGRFTTAEDIDRALNEMAAVVAKQAVG
ncbi:MAG: cysteine desulfurase [Candidatus Sericytochromatia bacterium]|nr:cysteine desulfurase [Candidatus Tanganyikabacteria bacterium]